MNFSQLSSYAAWSQECFSAHKNAVDQTGIAGNYVRTKITFPVIEYSTGSYDTTNSRFTPKMPGKYLIMANIYVGGIADNDVVYCDIYKNGVVYKTALQADNAVGASPGTITAIVDMNGTTDYIEIFGARAVNATFTVEGTPSRTWFQGVLIGATKQLVNPKYSNLVQEIKLTADSSAQVIFTGLDSVADGDYILQYSILNGTTNINNFKAAVNGDFTITNWDREYLEGSSAVNVGSNQVGNVGPLFNGVDANRETVGQIYIAVVNGRAILRSDAYAYVGGLHARQFHVCVYKAAGFTTINSIVIDPTQIIKAGSTFRLYRTAGAQQLVSYAPVDITSRTSDYFLKAGEVVYKTFSAATSVPLYITTQEGGEYEIIIKGDRSVAVSNDNAVTLSPNNTSYTNAIKETGYYLDNAVTYSTKFINTTSVFNLSASSPSKIDCRISTSTKAKTINVNTIIEKVDATQVVLRRDAIWNDTSTIWASLGTLTFPYAQSGTIVIKRIL